MIINLQNIKSCITFHELLTKKSNIMKTLVTLFAILFLASCESNTECFVCTTEIFDITQERVKVKEYDRTFCETFEWIQAYENEMTCITEKYYSPEIGINKEIKAQLITKCKIK